MKMSNVLGLILGGGKGTRLYPLTRERAKPAVPLAGKYRLIDIPMSNCLHAGIDKIAILTQFNSVSLHRHITRTYQPDIFQPGWVQILAAEQSPRSVDWYVGTADAVRKQWIEIEEARTDHVLILAGDHLYRMDYREFADFHERNDADITVAVQPAGADIAPQLGILKVDENGKIVHFHEKPSPEQLPGLETTPGSDRPYMASMGIYIFKTEVLRDILEGDAIDFGKDIIPNALKSRKVYGYAFDGFWEDIGTMRRFYEVNLMMAQPDPPFDFYISDRPIYTRPRFLPGSEIQGAQLTNTLVADGCRIGKASINNCIIGLRSIVGSDVVLEDTVMMGADFFERDKDTAENKRQARPAIGIGDGTRIAGAIIDKNARIGRNVVIRCVQDRPDSEEDNWVARDGIVIVPKNAVIPDGTVI
ncbi:MAG: glucose-1-phosphate adenylyltransferase [Anaerolineales bacterium]|nr:glucose-1-phosphate adenylyltransferase [Anaerolineales bacterium]